MARLIEADALKAHFPALGNFADDLWHSAAIRMAIDNAPTVDAVEVEHGRWEFSHTTTVEKYDVVKCSNCGHEAFAIAIYVKEGHYCPNCGAQMDLEVKDG